MNPMAGPISVHNYKYSVQLPMSFKIFPLNDILTVFPIQILEKKIFEELSPYMGMTATLVMRPGLFIFTLVPLSCRCFL